MIETIRSVFIVGIKGVAMANIAVILQQMGKQVQGSDLPDEHITDTLLKKHTIHVIETFDAAALPKDVDLVIYTGAHQGYLNPQVQEAKKQGINITDQPTVLKEIMRGYTTRIAVCGAHGKTTTSSLLSFALLKLGKKPGYMVGVPKFNDFDGGEKGEKDYFVVEADEYVVDPARDMTPKFHIIDPDYIIATNIDFDHPDVYKDLNDVKESFTAFFQKIASEKKRLIICGDDQALMDIVKTFPRQLYVTYGFSETNDRVVKNLVTDSKSTRFEVLENHQSTGLFTIRLFGEKNVLNTTAVITLLRLLTVSSEEIRNTIQEFSGAQRRFEKIAEAGSIYLFDDYAHHPHEIEATIAGAKSRFPGKQIIVIFQPHTHSRTEAFANEFIEALKEVDYALILPVFSSARERGKEPAQSSLVELARNKGINNLLSAHSRDELATVLKPIVRDDTVIFTMGAGDVYKLKDDIMRVVKST